MKPSFLHVDSAKDGLPFLDSADRNVSADSSAQSFMVDFAEASHALLTDESACRRAAAAQRLAVLGRPIASPDLIAALSDNSWEVRQAAVEALGQIGVSDAIAPLQDLLSSGNQDSLLQQAISSAIKSILGREMKSGRSTSGVTVDMNRAVLSQSARETLPSNGSPINESLGVAAIQANLNEVELLIQQRIEKEKQLAAEIEALRKAEADQLMRLEAANAEEETHRRIKSEAEERAAEEIFRLAELEAARRRAEAGAAIREAQIRAAESEQLNTEIDLLSKGVNDQITLMEEARSRLTALEEMRQRAETQVRQRAERELRLQREVEALRQVEQAQLQRIAKAESEAHRLIEEEARLKLVAEAGHKAHAEARERAAAEEIQRAEEEARRQANEAEEKLKQLATIQTKAEAAAQSRSEREAQINSALEALGNAAAQQLKRIHEAESCLRTAEARASQLAEVLQESEKDARLQLAEAERHQILADSLVYAQDEAEPLASAVALANSPWRLPSVFPGLASV